MLATPGFCVSDGGKLHLIPPNLHAVHSAGLCPHTGADHFALQSRACRAGARHHKVTVAHQQFTVGADGYINQNRLNFFDKCGAVFHDEVIRVLAKSPQWTPAREDGEAVAVTFTVPIVFAIPKENKIQVSDAKLEVEKSIENIIVVGFDK